MMNLAVIAGRLGSDPEIRRTTTGKSVARLSLATSRPKRDAQGAIIKKENGYAMEETEWHRVTLWNGLSAVAEKLRKGALVHVQGSIHYSTFTDGEGVTRYAVEIIAQDVKVLNWGRPDEAKDSSNERESSAGADDGFDDDVPF